ncbi:MAG: tRNA (guanosine(46)-N7)-methyltransferase TrmB [Gemmataceae bacterium]|nr:tRNA (guanosine(46)-N7)-methyltransferase TrmB [Gemmataceae bacterium]
MRRVARLPPEELASYLLEVPEAPAPLDWAAVFGNDHPVEVEVGFGKGLFLLTEAQSRPEVNFLGVEIERKYTLFTATRIAKRALKNVRLACADAKRFFRERVADASVQAVHVYFPDPWWKKRHHKRRLFNEEFTAGCLRVLRPGGRLLIASDVADYFAIMKELLAPLTLPSPPTGGEGRVRGEPSWKELPPPQEHQPEHDLDYLTNFERKYRQEGRPIYRAVYER